MVVKLHIVYNKDSLVHNDIKIALPLESTRTKTKVTSKKVPLHQDQGTGQAMAL